MDISNVKLDWFEILNPYIRSLEDRMPGQDIRSRFTSLIQDLNENRTRSRVIYSSGKPVAYSFLIKPVYNHDRFFANIGFTSENHFSEARFSNLLSWLLDEARSEGRYLALDDPFNVANYAYEKMQKEGLEKSERMSMSLSLEKSPILDVPIPQEYSLIPITGISTEQYSDLEFESFKGSPDAVLFSRLRDDRLAFSNSVFHDNMFGRVLEDASFLLKKGSSIAASILFTDSSEGRKGDIALLASIFTTHEFRGSGLSSMVLAEGLKRVKELGFRNVRLYTNVKNYSGINLYRKFSFAENDAPREIFYHNIPEGI